MKKILLSLLTFCALSAAAQNEIVVGDMNDDGQLTVGDVTALTDAVLDPQKQRVITMKCDPNVSDPAAIAGQWRAVSGTTLSLTAEGVASYSLDAAVKGFEYYPFSRDVVLLNAGGYAVKCLHVARLTADYLVFSASDGTCSAYYPSDRFASGFVLSATSLSLRMGEQQQLSVLATPEGSIAPSFKWTSSDTSVATVTADGLVTAVKGGTCTITATANDGSGVKASCTVTVAKPHEYVDLGLPSGTLWATCNVGAESPEDYGDYFAWGEVEPKSTYTWSTYKWMEDGYDDWNGCSKYTIADDQTIGCWYNNGTFIGDNKNELDLEDDAAYMKWGEGWRTPSDDQLTELRTKCTWTWTTQNGKNGCLITSKQNGRSLFLPAAGSRLGGSLDCAGSIGSYWSRSLEWSYSDDAYNVCFSSGDFGWGNGDGRCCGRSVRPVRVSASE